MNLKDAFLGLEKYFSPKIIGEVNDQYIKVVKIKGQEVPWHIHENEDELFYITKGTLLMEIIPAVAGISFTHSRPLQNHTDRRCWFALPPLVIPQKL